MTRLLFLSAEINSFNRMSYCSWHALPWYHVLLFSLLLSTTTTLPSTLIPILAPRHCYIHIVCMHLWPPRENQDVRCPNCLVICHQGSWLLVFARLWTLRCLWWHRDAMMRYGIDEGIGRSVGVTEVYSNEVQIYEWACCVFHITTQVLSSLVIGHLALKPYRISL